MQQPRYSVLRRGVFGGSEPLIGAVTAGVSLRFPQPGNHPLDPLADCSAVGVLLPADACQSAIGKPTLRRAGTVTGISVSRLRQPETDSASESRYRPA